MGWWRRFGFIIGGDVYGLVGLVFPCVPDGHVFFEISEERGGGLCADVQGATPLEGREEEADDEGVSGVGDIGGELGRDLEPEGVGFVLGVGGGGGVGCLAVLFGRGM